LSRASGLILQNLLFRPVIVDERRQPQQVQEVFELVVEVVFRLVADIVTEVIDDLRDAVDAVCTAGENEFLCRRDRSRYQR
jgi:predicted RecB family endonuclease